MCGVRIKSFDSRRYNHDHAITINGMEPITESVRAQNVRATCRLKECVIGEIIIIWMFPLLELSGLLLAYDLFKNKKTTNKLLCIEMAKNKKLVLYNFALFLI